MKVLRRYLAIHEASHAVVAIVQGGYAEGICIRDPIDGRDAQCQVSWPDDGRDHTEARLLTLAAGPVGTAIYRRSGLGFELLMTGLGDLRAMEAIANADDQWFDAARKLCRTHWPRITAVADAVMKTGVLSEPEIIDAMRGVAA